MSAWAACLRTDLRSRWRSLALLALLIAATSGVIGAALALAHRTATDFTRRSDEARAADAWIDPGNRDTAPISASPAWHDDDESAAEMRLGGVFLFFPEVEGTVGYRVGVGPTRSS